MGSVAKKPDKQRRRSSSLSPLWDDFTRMERQMEHMFGGLMPQMRASAPAEAASVMSVTMDVKETDSAYLVSAELAGVNEDDVDVSFKDGMLTLSGEKHAREECEEGENWHRMERSYGAFSRSFHFRDIVDEDHITANFKNGVLQSTLPKKEVKEHPTKHIKIRK